MTMRWDDRLLAELTVALNERLTDTVVVR